MSLPFTIGNVIEQVLLVWANLDDFQLKLLGKGSSPIMYTSLFFLPLLPTLHLLQNGYSEKDSGSCEKNGRVKVVAIAKEESSEQLYTNIGKIYNAICYHRPGQSGMMVYQFYRFR
jgi:hypothetical protein